VDPAHLFWLHGDTAHLAQRMKKYSEKHEFIRFEYGIMKRRTTPGKKPGDPPLTDQHPLLFPTILRHVAPYKDKELRHNLQIRVPVDDTHTQVFRVNFVPSSTEKSPAEQDPPFQFSALKTGPRQYNLDLVSAQDSMAWETQGAITDRTQEHLGASDEGVILLRKLLREQIEIVQKGGDPLGVIRNREQNHDIELDVINERIGLFRSASTKAEKRVEAS